MLKLPSFNHMLTLNYKLSQGNDFTIFLHAGVSAWMCGVYFNVQKTACVSEKEQTEGCV